MNLTSAQGSASLRPCPCGLFTTPPCQQESNVCALLQTRIVRYRACDTLLKSDMSFDSKRFPDESQAQHNNDARLLTLVRDKFRWERDRLHSVFRCDCNCCITCHICCNPSFVSIDDLLTASQ